MIASLIITLAVAAQADPVYVAPPPPPPPPPPLPKEALADPAAFCRGVIYVSLVNGWDKVPGKWGVTINAQNGTLDCKDDGTWTLKRQDKATAFNRR